jgi:gluconate 2-dehydrogenase gamma chain
MSHEEEMKEKTSVDRRRALKIIGVGVGAAGTLPVLDRSALGQHGNHHGQSAAKPAAKTAGAKPALKFFTPAEFAAVEAISELIIPADDHSPGAREAQVAAFIDLMVSESSQETKKLWRDGLAAVDEMSMKEDKKLFSSMEAKQQTEILTKIARNESKPQTLEERFFKAAKNLTIDGYYTSEVGIHKDLQYQGNAYLKEFPGCTHPEHQA